MLFMRNTIIVVVLFLTTSYAASPRVRREDSLSSKADEGRSSQWALASLFGTAFRAIAWVLTKGVTTQKPELRNVQTGIESNKKKQNNTDLCTALEGAIVNEDCVRFVKENLTFESAREACVQQHNGQDLWIPDFKDPFLLIKLMKYLPQVAGATEQNVWVGAQRHDGIAKTIKEKYVDDNYMLQIASQKDPPNGCITLAFKNGGLAAATDKCNVKKNFLCRLPLTEPTIVDKDENEIF